MKKSPGLFILLVASLVAAQPALSQDTNFGPPRETVVEGDVAASPISDRGLVNLHAFARLYGLARWFHPSDAALTVDWDRLAIDAIPTVEAAQSPQDLATVLQRTFAEIVPELEVRAGELASPAWQRPPGPRWQWQHRGFSGAVPSGYSVSRVMLDGSLAVPPHEELLPGGVSIRMPITAPVGQAEPTQAASVSYVDKPDAWVPAGFDRTTRIAATIAAWAVLDHFYPYWDVVDVDWEQELPDLLQDAALAPDDRAFMAELRRLLHAIQDGHGRILYVRENTAFAPIRWDWVEGQLVVTNPGAVAGLQSGAIVRSVNGRDPQIALDELMQNDFSGSPQFRRLRALTALQLGNSGSALKLDVEAQDGSIETFSVDYVPFGEATWLRNDTYDIIEEVEPGLLYVDLTRASDDLLEERKDDLAQARGIVFDLRGPPASRRPSYLSNLTGSEVRSAKFLMPTFLMPDQKEARFDDWGWTIPPAELQFTRNRVFLTNANAASYPESILGTIKGNDLSLIVGSATGGANGNITAIELPGGYQMIFTGLKVINRDGTVHHNIGIVPDVPVEPTIEGVRQGRDEVLDAGLDIVRRGM